MKKLLILALLLNALLLAGRFWQELGQANAQVATRNGDVNGDGERDIADPVYMLSWLFRGGPPPVAIAQEAGVFTSDHEEILSHLGIVWLPDGQGGTTKTLRVSRVNLQIVNGNSSLATNLDNPDAPRTGNLIVGYQEAGGVRTGYHNVIIGRRNGYSSWGGLVVGEGHTISGQFCSVTGGYQNTAGPGGWASVTGGSFNQAIANASSISGGRNNRTGRIEDSTVVGEGSSVAGGGNNTAYGEYSSVTGGEGNFASGHYSSVSGGQSNTTGDLEDPRNPTIGQYSSVSGGQNNRTKGDWSSVSGGGGFDHSTGLDSGNLASGHYSSVSGGNLQRAYGKYSSISGGHDNEAWGFNSSVSGGGRNKARGRDSSILGGENNEIINPGEPHAVDETSVRACIAGGQGVQVDQDFYTATGVLQIDP